MAAHKSSLILFPLLFTLLTFYYWSPFRSSDPLPSPPSGAKPVFSRGFEIISKLPADLEPTNKQVIKLAKRYVEVYDDKTTWFNWKGFRSSIDRHDGDDLVLDNFANNKINIGEPNAPVMAEKVAKYLHDALNVALSSKEVSSLEKNIEATFNHLKTTKEGKTTISKGSWEYRVLSAYPNPDISTDFFTLVITVNVEALVKEERSIFKTVISKNYSAGLSAMRLVVTKGFTTSS